jgi:hypothetical protein
MSLLKGLLCLLSLAALAALLSQGRAVSQLRLENQTLRGEIETGPSAAQAPQAAVAEVAPGEMERLRLENRDLLKLRNEVRQLREQESGWEKARAEHQRLLQAQRNAPAEATPSPTPEGFIGKEALVDLGLGTPEAAAQTFFWAMREGDFKRMLECVSPRFKRREGFDRLSAEQLEQSSEKMGQTIQNQMQTFRNFRIVERREVTPEEITLRLQSSFSGAVATMTLRRVGNEWLVDQPF